MGKRGGRDRDKVRQQETEAGSEDTKNVDKRVVASGWASGTQARCLLLQHDKGNGRDQLFRTCLRVGSHQGLVGREKGGSTVISSDGQQGHRAKLLTGKVRGGTTT